MIARPEQEDLVRGLVQIDKYKGNDFELNGWNLTKVLDDILMVQYVDINEAGTEIKRGNIWLPINAVQHTWRIGVGVKTVLLVQESDQLKFDVRGQRCIVYTRIKDLEEKLYKELVVLKDNI